MTVAMAKVDFLPRAEIVARGETPADGLLRLNEASWNGDLRGDFRCREPISVSARRAVSPAMTCLC